MEVVLTIVAEAVMSEAVSLVFNAIKNSYMDSNETSFAKFRRHSEIIGRINSNSGAGLVIDRYTTKQDAERVLAQLLEGGIAYRDSFGSLVGPGWASAYNPKFNPTQKLCHKKFTLRISNENVDYNGFKHVVWKYSFTLVRAENGRMRTYRYDFDSGELYGLDFFRNGKLREYTSVKIIVRGVGAYRSGRPIIMRLRNATKKFENDIEFKLNRDGCMDLKKYIYGPRAFMFDTTNFPIKPKHFEKVRAWILFNISQYGSRFIEKKSRHDNRMKHFQDFGLVQLAFRAFEDGIKEKDKYKRAEGY